MARELKMLLNIGLEDQDKYGLPDSKIEENVPPVEGEVVPMDDDEVADRMVADKVAKDYSAEEKAADKKAEAEKKDKFAKLQAEAGKEKPGHH